MSILVVVFASAVDVVVFVVVVVVVDAVDQLKQPVLQEHPHHGM